MADQDQSSFQAQVKLQLTTKEPDISLPENTGPILVNTSKESLNSLWRIELTTLRSTSICFVYAGEPPAGKREANSLRIPDKWDLPPHVDKRIPHRQWNLIRDRSRGRIRQGDRPSDLRCLLRARRLGKLGRRPIDLFSSRTVGQTSKIRPRANPLRQLRRLAAGMEHVLCSHCHLPIPRPRHTPVSDSRS